MPAHTIADAIALAIIAAGIACAWFWQIAPSARVHRDESRLPHIGTPWLLFAALAFFVIIGGILAQGLFLTLHEQLDPQSRADTAHLNIFATGALGIGITAAALFVRRLINARQKLLDTTLDRLAAATSGSPQAPLTSPSALQPFSPLALSRVLPVALGVYAITWTASALTGIIWNWLLDRLGVPPGAQDIVQLFQPDTPPLLLLALTLVTIVIAPVYEEILFRGALYGYLRTRLPRLLGYLLPSLIFALVHLNQGVRLMAPLFVFALVHCKAYERTGRIGVVIISHALFNLTTIAAVLTGALP